VVPPLDVEEGAGRFLFTVAMVDVDFFGYLFWKVSGQHFRTLSRRVGHTSDIICPDKSDLFLSLKSLNFISNHSNIQHKKRVKICTRADFFILLRCSQVW
jgi:hypothetical protein